MVLIRLARVFAGENKIEIASFSDMLRADLKLTSIQ